MSGRNERSPTQCEEDQIQIMLDSTRSLIHSTPRLRSVLLHREERLVQTLHLSEVDPITQQPFLELL